MSSSSLTWFLEVAVPELPPPPAEIPSTQNYTDTEVASAVDKLVQGAIRRPYGALGERQTNDTFDDTMDAAAGVFILTPSAPFYVLLLGAKRLAELCTGATTTASQLGSAVLSTNRSVRPLTNITSLGNAKTALQALESASSARDNAFDDIGAAPAFQRFDKHTDRFLSDAAANIRVGGEIVQTPQEARTQLAGLLTSLTDAHTEVKRRVGLLAVGIDNYNSLNLPALLAQGVISKAKGVLQDRIDQLDPLSPTDRLGVLRDTTLDVLAAKAVVKGFGSLPRSGTFVTVEGTGQVFSDADHLGTQATVSSDFLDPYSILAGADQLEFTVDGLVTPLTVPVPQSYIARLEGTIAEPYDIDATNNKVRVSLFGFSLSTFTATLSTDAAKSIEEVCTEINAAVGFTAVVAEPYFNPEKMNSFIVSTTNLVGSNIDFVLTAPTQWSTFGVVTGDKLVINDGPNAGSTFIVNSIATQTLHATLVLGTLSVQASVSVSVGAFNRCLRIRVTDAGAASAVDSSAALTLLDMTAQAGTTLGIFPGISIRCRRTRGDEVASAINTSLAAAVAGVPRVSAETSYSGGAIDKGRSEPTDPTRVISSIYRATGNVTTGGTSPVFAISGALSGGVVAGQRVTVRASPVAADVGRFFTVATVTDSQVTTFTAPVSVSLSTGVDLEFGRNLHATRDQILRIEAPSTVAGDYRTTTFNTNPTEITLDRPLPFTTGFGGQPLTFSMSLGSLRVDFKSLSTNVDSELSVAGTAAAKFFTSPPAQAIGSSPFILLQNDPKVLGAGDRFEIYTAQYNDPELSFAIIGFELGQKLLELDGQVPNSFSSIDFATDVSTPFARIRKVERNNYDAFKQQLDLWLQLPANQDNYFSDLNRFINPLIVNTNPTLSAVNTAKVQLQLLTQALAQLQLILAGYQVDAVPRVDTLVSSFLERGSDRAVDTLLEGRFTDFFGYNSEEVSYIGNALERLRDVSRLDLPVRRKARKEVIDQELVLGEFEEPDFEFDQSDTQDVAEPNIPGQFIDVPGSSF